MTNLHTINRHFLTKVIIALAIVLFASAKAFAQNNPYKINDKLYPLYLEADKKNATTEGLRLANELNKKAIELGDKKAQCLAFTIPMLYYEKNGNWEKFEEAVKNLKAVSRKYNYLQYYYFAYTMKIRILQDNNKQLSAIDELKQMKEEAMKDKYPYGISSYYRMLGNIYCLRRDYANAKKVFKQGLEYFKNNVKDQDQTTFNLMLASICNHLGDLDEGLMYIEDGLKNAKKESSRIALMINKARLLFKMGKKEEPLKLVEKIDKLVKDKQYKETAPYITLKVYQAMITGNQKEVEQWVNKIDDEDGKTATLREIAVARGDWKKAYGYLHEMYSSYLQSLSEQQSSDIAELSVRFQNEKLHSDMLEQKMKADQLMHEREKAQKEMALMTLTNSNMEMRQHAMSDSIDRAKLIIDKTRLKMNTELAQKQIEVEKAQGENLKSKFQTQRVLFVAGFLLMAAIVANLVLNKRKSKRFIKTLSDKNDELIVARDKAQQSEKMKTMFIQNVSHEIRTPLNAIVGFSNLLVDPNMEASEEEKQEFRNLIANNSELLTALVNDVLTLSELQSGKSGLNIAPCNVNELCRIAIKTVEHRRPEDVEIIFTTDAEENFKVNSDARRINQVLINFLTNAEKYTTRGSITVDCSLSKAPGYVMFSVTDTGCGIPKDKQAQIFERFEKLDDFHQGMGLGLNICAMIANLLNAKIGIDDSYTNGSRFYFGIPVKP